MPSYRLNFSVRIVDGNNVEATALAYVYEADIQTLAQVATAFTTWSLAVDAVIDGVITHGRILLIPTLSTGLKTTGTATTTFQASRVEQVGVFDFINATGPQEWGFAVPAFSNSLISSGKIILATTPVTTMYQLIAATPYCNNAAQVNTAFTRAFLATRKKRRQLGAESREV